MSSMSPILFNSFCLSHSNLSYSTRKCSTSSTYIITASWTQPNFPNACFFGVFTHVLWYHNVKSSCTVVSQARPTNPSIAIHAGLCLACKTKVTALAANHVLLLLQTAFTCIQHSKFLLPADSWSSSANNSWEMPYLLVFQAVILEVWNVSSFG